MISKAVWCTLSQCHGLSFVLVAHVTSMCPHSPTKSVGGESILLHLAQRSLQYWTMPRNLHNCLTFCEGVIARIALPFWIVVQCLLWSEHNQDHLFLWHSRSILLHLPSILQVQVWWTLVSALRDGHPGGPLWDTRDCQCMLKHTQGDHQLWHLSLEYIWWTCNSHW